LAGLVRLLLLLRIVIDEAYCIPASSLQERFFEFLEANCMEVLGAVKMLTVF
jgi:hypothetical protein